MPRRRSLADRERDAQAVDLKRRGLNHDQIAAQLGFKSRSSAWEAVRRGIADSHQHSGPEVMQMQLDRLDDYRRAALRILHGKHIAHSNGRVMFDPDTDKPLTDPLPSLHAIDKLLKIDDAENKLRDLYPPAKSRVEVITTDMVEAKIMELEADLATNDPAPHPRPT